MRHQWDEGEMFMGKIYSFCGVCGAVRSRTRVEADYINVGVISIDLVDNTDAVWNLDGVPRSCPGQQPQPGQEVDE